MPYLTVPVISERHEINTTADRGRNKNERDRQAKDDRVGETLAVEMMAETVVAVPVLV